MLYMLAQLLDLNLTLTALQLCHAIMLCIMLTDRLCCALAALQYVAAASAAAGYTLQQALSSAFSKCNIKATGGDPKLLLYSTNTLNCSDNQNNGYQRVVDALFQISLVGPCTCFCLRMHR
jgi:hypothetical protein